MITTRMWNLTGTYPFQNTFIAACKLKPANLFGITEKFQHSIRF
jgi:hypothetical protein